MRRHAKQIPLARTNLDRLIASLGVNGPTSWPRPLSPAFEILTVKLDVEEQGARDLLIEAVSAAHVCARAVDAMVMAQSREASRANAHKALIRLGKCAQRAPAELRRHLDRAVRTVLSRGTIDAVDVQRLIHRTGQVFRKFRKVAAAETALKAMGFSDAPKQREAVLATDIEAMHPVVHLRAVDALQNLSMEDHGSWSACRVFEVLAAAVSTSNADHVGTEVSDLFVKYVERVAHVWKVYGIKPSRARHPLHPEYTSRFHKFCDLVLMAFIDPGSLRHDGDLTQVRQRIRTAHFELPVEWRSEVSSSLRWRDHQWLISDDHLKRALAQKSLLETP
jgi:hypothetical protein